MIFNIVFVEKKPDPLPTKLSNIPNNLTSHVHTGAAPLLQTNNPSVISAGISGSILDHILPEDNLEIQNNSGRGLINSSSWNSLAKKDVAASMPAFREKFESFCNTKRVKDVKVIII